MDRQTNWGAITAITGMLSVLIAGLAGLPQIVEYYPQVINDLIQPIPLDFVATWGERMGLFLLGVTVGWFAYANSDASSDPSVDSIEGCVEIRGVSWKGTGSISDGQIAGIDVPRNPTCPDCQSPMNTEEVKRGGRSGIPARSMNQRALGGSSTSYYWKCPSSDCGKSKKKDRDRRDEAKNLLEKHFDRITKTEGEEYSLSNLIESVQESGGEVTGRQVWRRYVDIVDDSDVSTKCFPE